MKKYKVTFQKILDGHVIVYAEDEDDAGDFARDTVSDETFVVEFETFDGYMTEVTELDTNPNADLWS